MRCSTLDELPPPAAGKTGWPWTQASVSIPEHMPDGKPMPRISIVTPSYNQVAFIEEAIRSVLLQNYPNLEYIIIDGGSTDGSVDIIRKYDRWLTYWVSERDAGQSDAINKGWNRCTGELIAWMNSDDFYLPNAFQIAINAFIQNAAPDLVYGQISTLDRHGRSSGSRAYSASREKMLANLVMPPQAATFLKRAFLETIGGLDVSLHYVMDLALMLKVLANTRKIAYVPSPLAVFRFHPDSKTTTSEVEFARELLVVLDWVSMHWEDYPALRDLGSARVQSTFYRTTSKHLYLGNHFADSMRYIFRACRTDPAASFSILANEGVRWLVRRLLPPEYYRVLSGAAHLATPFEARRK